jgi:putative phosphotransacetylase
MSKMVPVGISAHHIHLSKADFQALFPELEDLTFFKALSQPGQYAAVEKLDVVSLDPKGKTIAGVRILGPLRSASQVELMRSECTKCKINGPVRSSGDTAGSGAVKLVNPLNGKEIVLEEGVIVADRHIHFSEEEAKEFGVVDKQTVSVKVGGRKGGIMNEVLCRVSPKFALDFHIDVDDASAFDLKQGDLVEVIL